MPSPVASSVISRTVGPVSTSSSHCSAPSAIGSSVLQKYGLRANLRHATHTIRDKRARAVAELSDWDRLRA
ncbi:hypothetical protein ACQKM2_38815, partial [Streptomyces sp. NPDC004126]